MTATVINATVNGYEVTGGNTAELVLQVGGQTAVGVDSGKRTKFPTTIGVGGATPAASGAGITFPATQSASSDANTLDDYEEGTWTPEFKGLGSNPTVTYTSQSGKYTKIGNLVYASAILGWSSFSGGSGLLQVSMPFVGDDTTRGVGSSPYNTGVNFGSYGQVIHTNPGNSSCYFIKNDSSGKVSSFVEPADVAASGNFQVAVVYKV